MVLCSESESCCWNNLNVVKKKILKSFDLGYLKDLC